MLLQIEQQYKDYLADGGFPYHMIIVVLIIGSFFFFLIRHKINNWKERKEDRKILEAAQRKQERVRQQKLEAENRKQSELEINEENDRKKVYENDTQKIQNESTEPATRIKKESVKKEETSPVIKTSVVGETKVITIESLANPISSLKRIGYEPSKIFKQDDEIEYPYVLMPPKGCKMKFVRKGRSNKIGHKEPSFFPILKRYFNKDYRVLNDRHMPTSSNSYPYEPDFILTNEKDDKNIFINVEIDESYDGYSRTPTHEIGSNNNRDNFFTSRGWIVVRFTELQIHQAPEKCCAFLAQVIASIDPSYIPNNNVDFNLDTQSQWSSLQSKKWAKEKYREKYLGIENFGVRPNVRYEYKITNSELDKEVEKDIPKSNDFKVELDKLASVNLDEGDKRITFDPLEHRYFIDGNADTISVSQLISKFFPEFDSEYWSERKARERGITKQEILAEWKEKGDTSASLGTQLHEEIENYYNGQPYNDDLPEFQHFLKFKEKYDSMIPFRSEWRIFDEDLLVAGTVDMVYQKEGNELYMFDWKRSEKIVNRYESL